MNRSCKASRQVHNFEMPAISHPLKVNFNNELILLGYDLPTRRVRSGQNLNLTLYWQSLRVVEADYFVFTPPAETRSRFDKVDSTGRLQEGYPVKFWYPGEIASDDRQIPVNADAAMAWSGCGWGCIEWRMVSGQTRCILAMVRRPGVAIGPVFIGTAAGGYRSRYVDNRKTPLAITWGEPPFITLRRIRFRPTDKNLQLTLYWRARRQIRLITRVWAPA